jgi:hypothetical protein
LMLIALLHLTLNDKYSAQTPSSLDIQLAVIVQ